MGTLPSVVQATVGNVGWSAAALLRSFEALRCFRVDVVRTLFERYMSHAAHLPRCMLHAGCRSFAEERKHHVILLVEVEPRLVHPVL